MKSQMDFYGLQNVSKVMNTLEFWKSKLFPSYCVYATCSCYQLTDCIQNYLQSRYQGWGKDTNYFGTFPGVKQKYAHYLWTTERLKTQWYYLCGLIQQLNTVLPTHQLQRLCSEMLLMLVPWPYRCSSWQFLANNIKWMSYRLPNLLKVSDVYMAD